MASGSLRRKSMISSFMERSRAWIKNARSRVFLPDQNEYLIYGEMVLLLKILRVAGVAPVAIKGQGSEFTVTVSRWYTIYCSLKFTVIGFTIAYFFYTVEYYQHQSKTTTSTNVLDSMLKMIFLGIKVFIVNAVIFHGVWRSSTRTKHLLSYVDQINKIYKRQGYCPTSARTHKWFRIQLTIATIGVIATTIFRLIAVCLFSKKNGPSSLYFFACFYIEYIATFVMKLQIVYVIQYIQGMLVLANKKLQKLLNELQYRNFNSRHTRLVAVIRDVTDMYFSSRDLAVQLNGTQGSLLIFILIIIILNLNLIINQLYFIFIYFDKIVPEKALETRFQIARLSCQIAFRCIFTIMLVEYCHGTHVELRRTRVLVSELLCRSNSSLTPLSLALSRFAAKLDQDPRVYAPMNIYTFSRSLYTLIIGSSLTFFSILLQLHIDLNSF